MKLVLSPKLTRALVMFFLWTFIPLIICTLLWHPFLGGFRYYIDKRYEREGPYGGLLYIFEKMPSILASPLSALGLPESIVFWIGLLLSFGWILGSWLLASYCNRLAPSKLHLRRRLILISVSGILTLYGLPFLATPVLYVTALFFLIPAALIFFYAYYR